MGSNLVVAPVALYCDNQAAVYTLHYYKAASPNLCEVARNIWCLMVAHTIHLSVYHIPGINKATADALSLKSHTQARQFRESHPNINLQILDGTWCALDPNIRCLFLQGRITIWQDCFLLPGNVLLRL